jgi:hypothetical protein
MTFGNRKLADPFEPTSLPIYSVITFGAIYFFSFATAAVSFLTLAIRDLT